MPERSMRHDELINRLKKYGIVELKKRGKGSERMLYQDNSSAPVSFRPRPVGGEIWLSQNWRISHNFTQTDSSLGRNDTFLSSG